MFVINATIPPKRRFRDRLCMRHWCGTGASDQPLETVNPILAVLRLPIGRGHWVTVKLADPDEA
jgi:hypothetical protein